VPGVAATMRQHVIFLVLYLLNNTFQRESQAFNFHDFTKTDRSDKRCNNLQSGGPSEGCETSSQPQPLKHQHRSL